MSMIFYGECDQDSPLPIYGQIISQITKVLVTQSTVSSLLVRVYEYASKADAESNTNGTQIGSDITLTKTSVIFDALQTTDPGDKMITTKGTGYNFATILPAASFPEGDKWYRADLRITPSSGDEYTGGKWVLECQARAGG